MSELAINLYCLAGAVIFSGSVIWAFVLGMGRGAYLEQARQSARTPVYVTEERSGI